MGKLSRALNFPTTYREEGLVGKLPQKASADYYLSCRALNFPTTYREEGLVGKLS